MRPWSRQSGASLIELVVALAILAVVAYGVAAFIGSSREQTAVQGARDELKGEVTNFSTYLLKTFRTRADPPIVRGDGLDILRRGRTNYNVKYTTSFNTVCDPLPAGHQLSGVEQDKIAKLSPCRVCARGQRPIIVGFAQESNTTFRFPSAAAGGMEQKPIAGGVCPSGAGATLSVNLYFALINPARLVVSQQHEVHLTTENATSGGVTILH